MQNTPSSSRPLAARVPGQLHTPTHSFSDAAPAFTPDSVDGKNIAWNKNFKEDLDSMRTRLTDQKFNISKFPLRRVAVASLRPSIYLPIDINFVIEDYEDPLLPRQHPPSHYYPNGVTAETEARLLSVIAKVKASSK